MNLKYISLFHPACTYKLSKFIYSFLTWWTTNIRWFKQLPEVIWKFYTRSDNRAEYNRHIEGLRKRCHCIYHCLYSYRPYLIFVRLFLDADGNIETVNMDIYLSVPTNCPHKVRYSRQMFELQTKIHKFSPLCPTSWQPKHTPLIVNRKQKGTWHFAYRRQCAQISKYVSLLFTLQKIRVFIICISRILIPDTLQFTRYSLQ